jgi:hypothetical protein
MNCQLFDEGTTNWCLVSDPRALVDRGIYRLIPKPAVLFRGEQTAAESQKKSVSFLHQPSKPILTKGGIEAKSKAIKKVKNVTQKPKSSSEASKHEAATAVSSRKQGKRDLKKKTLIMIPKTEVIEPEPETNKNQSIFTPIILSEKKTSKMKDKASEASKGGQAGVVTQPSKPVPNQDLQEP